MRGINSDEVPSLRQRLTKLAIRMGPNNPLIRFALRRSCRPASLRFGPQHIDVCRDQRIIRIALKHFPYARDMAQSFESYFAQVQPAKIGPDFMVDYSGPKLQTYPNGMQFEISSIPEEAETIESYLFWYTPKTTDTIFDLGAYCGVSTQFRKGGHRRIRNRDAHHRPIVLARAPHTLRVGHKSFCWGTHIGSHLYCKVSRTAPSIMRLRSVLD